MASLYQLNVETSRVFEGGRIMQNQDIRRAAAGSGVFLWQVAEAMGIADSSLSRKMRKELPTDEKQRIFGIIKELAKGATGA